MHRCPQCGNEKPPSEFYRTQRSWCKVCVHLHANRRKAKRRDTDPAYRRKSNIRSNANAMRLNDESRVQATQHHKPWTSEETAILLRQITAREAAALVGRTVKAVIKRRGQVQRRLDMGSIFPAHARKHAIPQSASDPSSLVACGSGERA